MVRVSLFAALLLSSSAGFAAEPYVIQAKDVFDQKAVIATVEPVHQIAARARIGGTIATLRVKEGDDVPAGAEIAAIGDPKLVLQLRALDARLQSQQSQRDQAKLDLDRVAELQRKGVSAQAQVDLAKTALDVAERNLAAMQSDRGVIAQQMSEGAVLAPGAGRVLSVAASEGRVVMPGETIATLAEDRYVLRLRLPERHARVMRPGDTVTIGSRGVGDDSEVKRREGKVRLVYPEIEGGRVVADVDVQGLGDYFVGERTRVWVTTGSRRAILIPAALLIRRAGVNLVKLADGAEVVVQPGQGHDGEVEILSGLVDGDRLAAP